MEEEAPKNREWKKSEEKSLLKFVEHKKTVPQTQKNGEKSQNLLQCPPTQNMEENRRKIFQ